MTNVLVLTGVTVRADLEAGSVDPDRVVESLGAIADVIP